jgi:hypothetical protein
MFNPSHNFGSSTMQNDSAIVLLRSVYVAFNERDIDTALSMMTPNVDWPRAFKGGFVSGPDAVRAYWTEQWSEINPHVEPVAFHDAALGKVLVDVHQVVHGLDGVLLADEIVQHRFTIDDGLIRKMEVTTPST